VLEIEVIGVQRLPDGPSAAEVRRLCELALGCAQVRSGHLAVEFVDAERIARLNGEHRDTPAPTDVLSFPIDGVEDSQGGLRELGDVVICPEHTSDMREAVVHGVLHLLGMDHETDEGQMLALQARLLERAGT
jgi:probable rRNA maturation factor